MKYDTTEPSKAMKHGIDKEKACMDLYLGSDFTMVVTRKKKWDREWILIGILFLICFIGWLTS